MLPNDMKIHTDKLEINNMHVKTFLITDFPEISVSGMVYLLTHGKHAIPGVNINFAVHLKPYTLKFDWQTKTKMNRLQKSIQSAQTGKASDTARKEEVRALESLEYFRDATSGTGDFADFWLSVTLSSADLKQFRTAIKDFKNSLTVQGFKLNELDSEQHRALESSWIGSLGSKKFFEKYHGRVMGLDALAGFYPFVDGSLSDGYGAYLGHRVADGTAIYKDCKKGSGNQNMLVTGLAGGGKSTFIKAFVKSLLDEGFKVYIFDVDGEYYEACNEYGGIWVDHTSNSGKYVDPTIIEAAILSEVDPKSLDPESLRRAKEADARRYNESVSNTRALFSMLSIDFGVNIDKQNALSRALVEMWEDAGIFKRQRETWDFVDTSKVGLYFLYERIKTNGNHDDGSKALAKDLWTWFDGPDSDMFAMADNGLWIKDNNLVVFHVASDVDNEVDQMAGAIKIVSDTHMTWQQIKRDRIKKSHFSCEVYDEWQRLCKNKFAQRPVYRSVTTGRKFNDQVILGFNDPSILFAEGTSGTNNAFWTSSKYKIFFSLEQDSIRTFAQKANIPELMVNKWLNLREYEYVYREKVGGNKDIYDILKMELPLEELELAKTRGLS